jgi:hypothetical protein
MKIRVTVSHLSGPSHQIVKAGKKCDEYVATVWFKDGWNMELRGATEQEVELKMARFLIGESFVISERRLNGKGKEI